MKQQQKTVLYVGGIELPDKNAAAHRVLAVGKLLRDQGCRVVFLGISHTDTRPVLGTRTEVEGFTCYAVPYPKTLAQWPEYLADIRPVRQVI